jgi:hypothetical protein
MDDTKSSKKYDCRLCGKQFTLRQTRLNHEKFYCKESPQKKKACSSNDSTVQDLVSLVKKQTDLIEKLLSEKNGTTNITTNTIINENVIIVNNYGNENLQHIKPEFLSECIALKSKGFLNLLSKIYFDPDCPENQTIKVISRKREVIGTFLDGKWVAQSKNTVLDSMINKGYKILHKHHIDLTKNNTGFDPQSIEYDEYINTLMAKKNNKYFMLRKDVYMMVENKTFYVLIK